MKLIRKNTFETNSSSTHALVIPHKVDNENYDLYDSLEHNYTYGREECRLVEDWDEKLAYIYITIKNLVDYKWNDNQYKITKDMVLSFKERINKIYKEVYDKIKYKPYDEDLKPNDIFKYIDKDGKCSLSKRHIINSVCFTPFVEHVGEFSEKKELFDKIFKDDEFLKRFIFNKDSYITIGGDEYRGYNIKTIGFEYDYDADWVNKGTEEKPDYQDEGEFWDKLKEYEKNNDVFLKGN